MRRISLLIGFLFMSAHAWAGIAVSSQTFGGDTTATTLTWSMDCKGGNLLVVGTKNNNGILTTGVTYNGVAMTISTQAFNNGGPLYASLWYLVNPAAGANNVVATSAAGTFHLDAGGVAFSGVNTSNPIDTSNCAIASDASTSISVSLTTGQANEYIADVLSNNNSGTLTVGGSQVLQWPLATAAFVGASTLGPVAAGSNSMTWTTASFSQPVMCASAINPAAAAATGPSPFTGYVQF